MPTERRTVELRRPVCPACGPLPWSVVGRVVQLACDRCGAPVDTFVRQVVSLATVTP